MDATHIAKLAFDNMTLFALSEAKARDHVATAVAIAMAESGGNETVISPPNKNGTIDVGLWQINSTHRKTHPLWTTAWLQNPTNNAKAMNDLSHGGDDWSPWSSYKSGRYKSFMDTGKSAVDAIKSGDFQDAGTAQSGIDPGALPGVDQATSALQALGNVGESLLNAGKWLTDPSNILRIVEVGGGIALAIAAAVVLMKPVIDEAKGFV